MTGFQPIFHTKEIPMKNSADIIFDEDTLKLMKVGGLSTIIAFIIVLLEGVIIYAITGFDFREDTFTAINWFQLIERSRLLAIIDKTFIDIIFVLLLCPLYLGLFYIMRKSERVYSLLLTIFIFIGFAAYIPTNTSFTILFAADVFKNNALTITSAEGLQAISKYGMYYSMGFLIVTLANIFIVIKLLRNKIIAKWISIVGLAGNILILTNYISFAFTPTTNELMGMIVFPLGGSITLFWYFFLGINLLLIYKNNSKHLPRN
jgi:hypothetical protein